MTKANKVIVWACLLITNVIFWSWRSCLFVLRLFWHQLTFCALPCMLLICPLTFHCQVLEFCLVDPSSQPASPSMVVGKAVKSPVRSCRPGTQWLTSEALGVISATNYGWANTLANSPAPGRILSSETIFYNCQVALGSRLSLAVLSWCGSFRGWGDDSCWLMYCSPTGNSCWSLALKDRFQETSQTFPSLLFSAAVAM